MRHPMKQLKDMLKKHVANFGEKQDYFSERRSPFQLTHHSNEDSEFEIYIRLTTVKKEFAEQIEIWPIKSMKLFFQKKFANLLIVMDDENKQDHEYGDKFHELHPDMNTSVCYMKPLPKEYYHGWGKARMYMDMMHADVCSTKEYVGFIDVDTLFVTAVTENLLFEDKKPIITGRIGIPRVPCWIQTGQYILGMKQVMQCMSYFPVTFKVSHIVEMRKHVERVHNKSFAQVFKEAPEAVKVHKSCYCHYSIMCNYMWYFYRNEYAWHLQMVPHVGPEMHGNAIETLSKRPRD
eukprot:gene8214-biopygen6642